MHDMQEASFKQIILIGRQAEKQRGQTQDRETDRQIDVQTDKEPFADI